MGQSSAALASIDQLRTNYPHSSWLNDAGALEIEIKRASGQAVNPKSQGDEDLQLLALNSLMDRDCGTAVPLLQGVLSSNKSDKVKERALYVLVQHDCPNSHQALLALAKRSSNPALQAKAVDFLGSLGGADNLKTLVEIYKGSDTPVKRRVLHAFQNLGAKNELLSTMSTEKDPELRRYAVQGLANLGATAELRNMYDSAASTDEKREILHSLANLGDSEGLRQLAPGTSDPVLRKELIHDLANLGARNELLTMYSGKSSLDEKKEILHSLMNLGDSVDLEKFAGDPSDPDIRAEAISALANTGSAARPVLTKLYANETNVNIKKSIIHALYNNNDAHDLVAIARKETDPDVRRYAIDQLSRMSDKEAQDFLIELLNK
jgi:HEAT repeat protein